MNNRSEEKETIETKLISETNKEDDDEVIQTPDVLENNKQLESEQQNYEETLIKANDNNKGIKEEDKTNFKTKRLTSNDTKCNLTDINGNNKKYMTLNVVKNQIRLSQEQVQKSVININDQDIIKENLNKIPAPTTIKKYPFNGKSPHLISKIFIIGYEQNDLSKILKKRCREIRNAKIINKTLKEKTAKYKIQHFFRKKESLKIDKILISEKPIVLSCYTTQNSQSVDNNIIISFIFPYNVMISNQLTRDYYEKNIIFSFNIPLSNDTISSNNYYAYIYHEEFMLNGDKYYSPKAICFQSNFPYFIHFQALSKYYIKLKATHSSIADLWFYHLVNLPSPMNISYQLYHTSTNGLFDPPKNDQEAELQKNPRKELEKESNIFYQLTGYPLFHFKLDMLLKLFTPEFIIEVFILTFLELDLIFFSEELEILNLVMYIFANLNYPLNDSSYFFHIISVSLDTFLEGTDSLVSKTFSSMLGVNASYDQSFANYAKKTDYYVIDLEKKQILYQYRLESETSIDIATNKQLKQYLTDLFDEKKKIKTNNCFDTIILELLLEIKTLSQQSIQEGKQDQKNFFYVKKVDLEHIDSLSHKFQEKFYYFIIKTLAFFHDCFHLNHCDNTNKFVISFENKSNEQSIEGIFLQKFKDCSKYNTYCENFIQSNNSIDVFKIPLLFLEEFINQYKFDKEKSKNAYNILKHIDIYYDRIQKAGFKIKLDSYFNLFDYSQPSSKLLFELKHRIKKKKIIRSQNKNESISCLFSYINYKKNFNLPFFNIEKNTCFPLLDETEKKLYYEMDTNTEQKNYSNTATFKLLKELKKRIEIINNKQNKTNINEISEDNPSFIQGIIEKFNIDNKKMNFNEILICCFIMLFIVSREFNAKENLFIVYLLIIKLLNLRINTYSSRKYITMLIILLIKIIEKQNAIQAVDLNKQFLIKLIALLLESKIIPNEELMQYLNGKTKNLNFQLDPGNDWDDQNALIINTKNKDYFTASLNFNFSKDGIKNEEEVVNLSRNSTYSGNLFYFVKETEIINEYTHDEKPIIKLEKGKDLKWNIYYQGKVFSSHLFTQFKLYNHLTKLSQETIRNYCPGQNIQNEKKVQLLNDIIVNLIFYIQYIPDIFEIEQDNILSETLDNEKSKKSRSKLNEDEKENKKDITKNEKLKLNKQKDNHDNSQKNKKCNNQKETNENAKSQSNKTPKEKRGNEIIYISKQYIQILFTWLTCINDHYNTLINSVSKQNNA